MVGTGIPQLLVRAVLPAPPAKVWDVVDNCAGYRRSMPRVVASRELSRTPASVQCEMTVGMPFPFQDMVSVSESVLTLQPGRWHRTFHQVRGDYVKNDGYWLLAGCGADQTLVEYQVHAILGGSIPDVLVRRGQLTAMRDMMRRLGELVAPGESR